MSETDGQRMYRLVTENLLRILSEGRKQVTKDGAVVMVDASPSDIREARAWAKELMNSGNADPAQSSVMQQALLRFQGKDIPVDEDLADTGT